MHGKLTSKTNGCKNLIFAIQIP